MKTLEDATQDRYHLTESSAAVDGWCHEVDQEFKKRGFLVCEHPAKVWDVFELIHARVTCFWRVLRP